MSAAADAEAWSRSFHAANNERMELKVERDKLRTQLATLRAALERIMELDGPGLDLSPAGIFHKIAHEALAQLSSGGVESRNATVELEHARKYGTDSCCGTGGQSTHSGSSDPPAWKLLKTQGERIIDAVVRACALEQAIIEDGGTVFVWSANAAEQIEAALAEEGWTLIQNELPVHYPPAGTPSIPRRPWLLSKQYSMTFVISQDNEIIIGFNMCALLGDDLLRVIIKAVNAYEPSSSGGDVGRGCNSPLPAPETAADTREDSGTAPLSSLDQTRKEGDESCQPEECARVSERDLTNSVRSTERRELSSCPPKGPIPAVGTVHPPSAGDIQLTEHEKESMEGSSSTSKEY